MPPSHLQIDPLTARWAARHNIQIAPAPDNMFRAYDADGREAQAASPRAAFAACLRLQHPAPSPTATNNQAAASSIPRPPQNPQREPWLDVKLTPNMVITKKAYSSRPGTKMEDFYNLLTSGMTVRGALIQGSHLVPNSTLRAYLQRLALSGAITLS